jgi:guanylate kinase
MNSLSIRTGKLFIISSPTGGGKTTIVTEVLNRLQNKVAINKIITSTTRKPRNNEINKVDYNFITKEEFKKLASAGSFLETNEYAGELYGSPASMISELKAGRSFIIIADNSGAKSLAKLIPESILIWITVSNVELIKERLQKRNGISSRQTELRYEIAQEEFELEERERFFQYHVINDNLETAIQQTIQIIKTELAC